MSVEPRCQILVEYAKWTALSAVRTGAPIRDRETVYRLLDGVTFAEVLSGEPEISFDCWHQCQTEALCSAADHLRPDVVPFPVGWSAKLISRMVAHYSAGATAERGAVARYL